MSTFQSDASKFGQVYEDHVAAWLKSHHMTVLERRHRHESGVEFDLFVKSWRGDLFGVECKGSPNTANQPAMVRSDNRWKVFGYLNLLNKWRDRTGGVVRYLLITSKMPPVGSDPRYQLDQAELLGELQIIEVPAPDLKQAETLPLTAGPPIEEVPA
jgi:Holliday junction resolvase-like predicted endonuclease